MTRTAIPYDFPIDIERADIDFMGHVNNASYLKWVQAAIVSHWEKLAPRDIAGRHLWVALKHEITYRKPAFLDDDVIATVILQKVHGAKAFYEIIIKRRETVLAEVRSSWCCLDSRTRRPRRLSQTLIERFLGKE